jgi:type VI secretion system secreted protein VgrG
MRVPFTLTVSDQPQDTFLVHRLRGRERLSAPYTFDVVASSSVLSPADVDTAILGRRAALVVAADVPARTFHGIIASVRNLGTDPLDGASLYRMRLSARVALLRQMRTSRIFQNLSTPEAIAAVIGRAGLPFRFALEKRYPKREFCTQYEETDLAFVRRLLSEAGIVFFFEQATGDEDAGLSTNIGESLVFVDNLAAHPGIDGQSTLFLRRSTGMVTAESSVHAFHATRCVRPSVAVYRDFDPERPLARLVARATCDRSTAQVSPPPALQADLEVYDHHGQYLFPNWDHARGEPELVLTQERRRAHFGGGESTCARMQAGRTFTLEESVSSGFDGDYLCVEVSHRGIYRSRQTGGNARVYANTFACVPAPFRYVLPRTPRRCIQACVTAEVVGNGGDDIAVDDKGRVRVQFHWDRDAQASCWIRVMQPWAGAGWGVQFIPRVGQEVVVGFEGGDPDKPMILGSLYNGTHLVAFPLPSEKTKSGLRTQSSPGGGGYNELSFDDAAAQEKIYLRAQKDLELDVLNDRTATVRNSDSLTVMHDRSITVLGDHREQTRGDHEEQVGGSRTVRVEGHHNVVVTGDRNVQVTGSTFETVAGAERTEVTGASDLVVTGDRTLRTTGCLTHVVGAPDAARSFLSHVEGTSTLSSSKTLELTSTTEVVLRCGKSTIRLGTDTIDICSPTIHLFGDDSHLTLAGDEAKLYAKTNAITTADKIVLKSNGASLGLTSDAKLDGDSILLKSSSDASDSAPDATTPQPTTIELKDQDGNPLPGQRFIVIKDDGSQQSGVLDDQGKVSLVLDGSAKVLFPDVSGAAAA